MIFLDLDRGNYFTFRINRSFDFIDKYNLHSVRRFYSDGTVVDFSVSADLLNLYVIRLTKFEIALFKLNKRLYDIS